MKKRINKELKLKYGNKKIEKFCWFEEIGPFWNCNAHSVKRPFSRRSFS